VNRVQPEPHIWTTLLRGAWAGYTSGDELRAKPRSLAPRAHQLGRPCHLHSRSRCTDRADAVLAATTEPHPQCCRSQVPTAGP
jgi:hypothetical protein